MCKGKQMKLITEMIITVIGSIMLLAGGIILFFATVISNKTFAEIGVLLMVLGMSIIVFSLFIMDIVNIKRKRIK